MYVYSSQQLISSLNNVVCLGKEREVLMAKMLVLLLKKVNSLV